MAQRGRRPVVRGTGGYTYVDPYGVALGYEDVFTKLEKARLYFDSLGLGPDYVQRFVR
jgi:2,4'-dihydroxyacetophenone dioxygenase